MSDPISSENPVVMFGDIGPDVVKLSQIYDPDSDEFSLSKDELAIAGKKYYTRSYTDKTVSFTEVSSFVPGEDTPEANDWYEPNVDGFVSTGKYVPAEKSLVVVDVATEEYNERTILIVDSVDEVTLKSKLVPHNCGAEGSTTARALKYGNGDYQLYFEEQSVSTPDRKVVLTPDRKLMLYGSRYYMYMLRRNGKVISTPVPESIETSENGLVPYISPTSKRVTVTGNNKAASSYYGNFAGCRFDTLCGTRFNSITIPTAPAEGDSHPFVPTFDSVYRGALAGETTTVYWFFEKAHYELTKDTIYSGTKAYYSRSTSTPYTYSLKTVTAGTAVLPEDQSYEYLEDKWTPVKECVYRPTLDTTFITGRVYYKRNLTDGRYLEVPTVERVGNPYEKGLYYQETTVNAPDPGKVEYYYTANTVVGWLIKVETDTEGETTAGYTNYAAVQIQQNANKAFGTGISGYIVDVASASTMDDLNYTGENHVYYPDSCYLKAGFSIVSGETVDMEVYELRENSTDLRMVMNVTLTTKEATILDGTDTTSKKISYLDAELKDNVGDIWLIGLDETVADFVKRITPILSFDDGSTKSLKMDEPGLYVYGLERINTMPCAGRQFQILFKYFPNASTDPTKLVYINSNSSKNFVSCTKIVQVADSAATTIRKISLLPVWDHRLSNNTYSFKYLVYRTDFKSPAILDDLGSIIEEDGRLTKDESGKACAIKDAMYLDDKNIVRPTESSGDLFGYIQHANLDLYVIADGYKNAQYSQRIALQLQNWEVANIPAKWLLGDNTDNWEASLMPYGNPNAGIRPYIEFDGALAQQAPDPETGAVPKPFRVGLKFASSKDDFLNSFYNNANPPSSDIDAGVGNRVEPNHFLCRSFMTRDLYTAITNADPTLDLALEELKDCYYDTVSGRRIKVTVEVGKTNVANYEIRVAEGTDFYTKVDDVWVNAELEVGSYIAKELKSKYFLKKTVEVNSGYIYFGVNENADWCSQFSLLEAYMSKEVEDKFGGAVPFVFGNESATSNKYNTQCMGTVIMEFVYMDDEGIYKHLYGAPVEVRHPYELTKDPTYVANKSYYVYGYSNATESDVPVYNPSLPITIDDEHPPVNRFYRIVGVTEGATITNTPLAVWETY